MMDINATLEKNSSRLCIGIDPRTSFNERLKFSLNLVDETAEYACAYKPNIQFWHGSSKSDLITLTDRVHSYDLPAIADLKISDIGSTNKTALENLYSLGFDYVTHSPFPGNTKQTNDDAKAIGIGIITLVVMSNPEAKWMVDNNQFVQWAKEAEQYSDGAVIGTTNHITGEILDQLAELMPTSFILAPGIGSQGGSMAKLKTLFDNRVMFNVSRGINSADNFRKAAQKFRDIIAKN